VCREDALSFLTTCFPGDPLAADILAGCGGDANAATAKLLELRDEEQAHDLAAAMQEAQELSAAPAKVRGCCELRIVSAAPLPGCGPLHLLHRVWHADSSVRGRSDGWQQQGCCPVQLLQWTTAGSHPATGSLIHVSSCQDACPACNMFGSIPVCNTQS
jgi:hypothetical protein